MMTLKRKVETGFVAFIRSLASNSVKRYHGYEASEAKERKFPGYVIKASGESEVFPCGAPRRIQLEIIVMTAMSDNAEAEVPNDENRARLRTQHDDVLATIEAALEAPGAPQTLAAFFNVGATKRTIEDFHFYDITKNGETMSEGGTCFADLLTFEVVCQNCDGA